MRADPFFSVVIPTMNRPSLVRAAVDSVVQQTYRNFEVIVSDNSTSVAARQQTSEHLRRSETDKRVRAVRPDSWLNMPDHWEFASRHATGKYVLILTDRHVMRPSALNVLKRLIDAFEEVPPIIAWHSGSTFDGSGVVHTAPSTGITVVSDARSVVAEFASCSSWRQAPVWVNRLPRALNSAFSAELASEVRRRHGRLFFGVSPDYTSAFLLLAYASHMAYIDRPLYLNHGVQSNGRNSIVYGDAEYLRSLGDIELFPSDCPSRLPTVTNLLFRDLLFVRSLVEPAFRAIRIDPVGYLLSNYRELLYMERLGSQRDVASLRAEWWALVQSSPPEVTSAVHEGIRELVRYRPRCVWLRRWCVRYGQDRTYHKLRSMVSRWLHGWRGVPVYRNVLEAACLTDTPTIEAFDLPDSRTRVQG